MERQLYVQFISHQAKYLLYSIGTNNFFFLFDTKKLIYFCNRVCLLSDGQVAYFGGRKEAIDYFDRKYVLLFLQYDFIKLYSTIFSLNLQCPQYTNPADFFIDALGVDMTEEKESRLKYF